MKLNSTLRLKLIAIGYNSLMSLIFFMDIH